MDRADIPEIDIKSVLLEIAKRGFIKSLRKSDTGIGYTLETEMGIKENNLKNGDFTYNGEFVELKTQRRGTSSNITLFTKEPNKGEINDSGLINRYGYINGNGRKALKITLTTKAFTPQGLKLNVNRAEKKISIIHKDDGEIWFWTIGELKPKIQNLLLVFADRKKEKGAEYFYYSAAYFFSGFDDQKFLDLIEDSKIVVDLRMHIKKEGTVRNHGTAFRIVNLKQIESCYDKKERIVKLEE